MNDLALASHVIARCFILLVLVLGSVSAAAGPTVNDQGFAVSEAAANGASVGTVSATDPDGDLMTYSITAGNGLGIFAIDADTGAITIASNTNLDYETISGHAIALTVSVIDRNQIENFDSMGTAGTTIPTSNGFTNWTTTFSTPSTLDVGPAAWGGSQSMYNVGTAGNTNRALGVYSSNGGTNRTYTCKVTVPASGNLTLTWDTFLAWNRMASTSNRWGGVKLTLTGGDSSTSQATLTQSVSSPVTTWMNSDTAVDKVTKTKTWTGVTPGQQTLSFIGHVTTLGTPSGYSSSNNKNQLVAIDNLEIGNASKVADTATVTITINDANDLPTLTTNTGFAVDPTVTKVITNTILAASDVEQTDSALTYTVTTAPGKGTLKLSGSATSSFTQGNLDAGLVTYTHSGASGSSDSFIVTVSDGVGGNLTGQTINITVGTAPTAEANGTYTVVQGNSFNLSSTGSGDTDGDGLTYAWDLDGDAAYDDASGASPSVPWSTMQSIGRTAAGNYTIGLQVTSAKGGVATDTANLTILSAPVVATNSGMSVDRAGTRAFTTSVLQVTDSDESASQLVYTITSAPSSGSLKLSGSTVSTFTQANVDGGLVTYTHDGSSSSSDSFNFTVNDGTGGSVSGTVNLTITTPPVANAGGPYTLVTSSALALTASASADSDGDGMSYAWDLDNDGQYDDATGVSPNVPWSTWDSLGVNSPGSATIKVQVTSVAGGVDTASASVTILSGITLVTNTGMTRDRQTTTVIDTNKLRTVDSDDGPAALTYTITSAPTAGSLMKGSAASTSFTQADIDAGSISYVHSTGSQTSDSFAFTVSDGKGASVSGTFAITLTSPPVASIDGPYVLSQGQGITLVGTASDADGDALTYSWDINGDGTFGDASTASVVLSWSEAVKLALAVEGTKTVRLLVTSAAGGTASAENTVTFTAIRPLLDTIKIGLIGRPRSASAINRFQVNGEDTTVVSDIWNHETILDGTEAESDITVEQGSGALNLENEININERNVPNGGS